MMAHESGTTAHAAPASGGLRRGRVVIEDVASEVLRDNRAGDSHVRRVPVYLPPSYDTDTSRRFPVVHVLAGFMGRGRTLLNDNPWSPAIDDRMDALVARGACEEMILVLPDCFTRYGGSQYLNSSATGRYEDHLVHELVPFIDARYRTLPDRRHRGLAGKSSGGYGTLALGMRYSSVFGALACHSGDICFDYAYRGDVPRFCAEIQRANGVRAWLETFEAKRQKVHDDFVVLNILGMSAAYSPNPKTEPFGIDFPCDFETGRFRDDVWERWIEHDPLTLLELHVDGLRSLESIHIDCGVRDEWHLHLGARMFSRRLEALGVLHDYEEFDDGHMNVSYRYEVSLPKMGRALAPRR